MLLAPLPIQKFLARPSPAPNNRQYRRRVASAQRLRNHPHLIPPRAPAPPSAPQAPGQSAHPHTLHSTPPTAAQCTSPPSAAYCQIYRAPEYPDLPHDNQTAPDYAQRQNAPPDTERTPPLPISAQCRIARTTAAQSYPLARTARTMAPPPAHPAPKSRRTPRTPCGNSAARTHAPNDFHSARTPIYTAAVRSCMT